MKMEMNNANRKIIGDKIKELRLAQNLTQEQLARKAGILRITLSRIELGKYSVGVDILSKIAHALDCKIGFISTK